MADSGMASGSRAGLAFSSWPRSSAGAISERLARSIEDPRAPERIRHAPAETIRCRPADRGRLSGRRRLRRPALRSAFKMAVGRLPESGADLCAQATMSRLETLPGPVRPRA